MEYNKTPPKADFDHFASDYENMHKKSVKAAGFELNYFDEHKIKIVYDNYNTNETSIKENIQILNFGCGIGKSEFFFNKYFPNCSISSVDISEKSIAIAKEKNKQFKNIEFIKFNTCDDLQLTAKFDIIFVANVFHHMQEELHLTTLKHLKTLLSSTGYIYIFEHNPVNPLTRKAFESCEFDVGCKMIKPELFIELVANSGYRTIIRKYILFFPKFLSFFSNLEKWLTWCPIGAQYYIKAK